MRQSSLVVVANRLPLDDSAAPDGACEWRRSPGGLASALHAILQKTPATWVGWGGKVGSLEKGHYADLIAVDGDPLADVKVLESVKFVMKGGTVAKNDFAK